MKSDDYACKRGRQKWVHKELIIIINNDVIKMIKYRELASILIYVEIRSESM
jgi:hypothetical protein